MNRSSMIVGLSFALIVGCSKPPAASPGGGGSKTPPVDTGGTGGGPGGATAAKLIDFENGLSRDDREAFYHIAEGSEVFPLHWLHAIDNVHTGKRFLADVERFGLIPDPDNPDGLPIGLTGAEARGLTILGRMVGVNCAACHVG